MKAQGRSDFPLRVERALVLAAHTDDEWGCAGTMIRLANSGAEIRYIAMSRCEESVPAGFPKDVLFHECHACLAVLGVKKNDIEIWNFPVRFFPDHRQEILQRLVDIRKDYSPDLVLLPSSSDTHQDHATLFNEGFRAYKHASIFGYEMPQNMISFENSAFIILTEKTVDQKADALLQYKSQAFRPYGTREFIKSLAKVRGVQCAAEYAEAFELVRLTLK